MTELKEVKPRTIEQITQEYLNACAALGDLSVVLKKASDDFTILKEDFSKKLEDAGKVAEDLHYELTSLHKVSEE